MKIERISGKEARRIVTAMVVDVHVLGRIASKWEPNLFKSKWANIVGEMCVKYFKRHHAAPKKSIEGMFESWASDGKDKDTVALVERFLSGLSEEYESLAKESNSSYLIDTAARHFTRVKLERLAEQLQGLLDAGDVDKAKAHADKFTSVEMGAGSHVDVLKDKEALKKAFAQRKEPLIQFKGGLGVFFGQSLTREGFIIFLAPEKRGKTAWMVELAWRCMLQRRRVVFFSVGDESQEEMMLRFAVRGAQHPIEVPEAPIRFPLSMEWQKDSDNKMKISVEHEAMEFEKGLTHSQAQQAIQEVLESVGSSEEFLRLSVHPSSSLSIAAMDQQLESWARDSWTPDVIIVDYMDILLESNPGEEKRHRINATWSEFRGLLQRWHALGISATQADAASYTQELLLRSNFSEDKRKLAHVTGMVGINQNATEKDENRFRLNWIVRRGAKYSENKCCHVAGCMELASPCIRSLF
jgi:hypothetical protein